MEVRHDMEGYSREEPRQCVQLYLPEVGNVTITFESYPKYIGHYDPPKLVLSVDFSVERIRIIDSSGMDRTIQ
jgi:hypothetical protein